MTKRQFRILAVLTLVAGFLGGAVSNLLLQGTQALAQEEGDNGVIQATRLELVDDGGKVRATLGATDGTFAPALALNDFAGKRRAVLSLGADGAPGLSLYDATGRLRTRVGGLATVNKATGSKTDYPESNIMLFQTDGTISWRAP